MTQQTAPPPSIRARCAGCRTVLYAAVGVTELPCPNCQMPKTFPNAIDPSVKQLHCSNCKAVLNAPRDDGVTRFPCPQCCVELDINGEDVNELVVEVERDEDDCGMAGETFTDYRPAKVSIGGPHPDPVVETSSLSAVQPPDPTYDPKVKDDLEKALSCLQIEALVYACQRHLQHLPSGDRAGFFIGDGAGVGKGRTIAGLIWENWHHGRRKALWISIGSDLKFDARRDLDDMGATCIKVHALNKLPYSKLDSKSVGVKEGVIFSTYSSLIASSEKGHRRSRLKQLVQWCGPGFDGLLIFDECHKAKNLVPEHGKKPTQTGEAVLDIQAELPQARVVYCSATGASEPRNMGYMVRLGLWGAGTSFGDFGEFLGALEKGGVGALELVAMDMKARGMYLCRTLSYKGAEFEIVEAPLEDKMMDMYTKAAEFWIKLRVEILSAIDSLNVRPDCIKLWRLYWATHQRFFRHLCLSAKVPATVRLVKQALKEDKCVVIGLRSTGEARTEEAVSKNGSELDDFVSGPRELLLKFVEENYLLPEKPDILPGEGGVMELKRKRHSASPDVTVKGRIRKVAKWQPPHYTESDEESETSAVATSDSDYGPEGEESAASDLESTDSDYDELLTCEICTTEEEKENLLQCSCCGKLVHQSCVMAPTGNLVPKEWSCYSCKEKTDEYLHGKHAYITELQKSYGIALERKTRTLEMIRSLDLPSNPLDDIIDQLGGPDNVAEMTGRKGMLVRAPNGKGVTYQARNTKDVALEMVNMHEKELFMDAKKLVAIISEAGSAGISLQADKRVRNQKRRVHLTLELPWSADQAIQQFGRTHRSNQASAPEYRLLLTNLGGERRFASVVAKRLESLGALTQGDRRAGPSLGPSLSGYNYDSAYGKRALMILYNGIMEKDSLPIVPPGCLSETPDTILGFIIEAKASLESVGIGWDHDMHDVGRFLNRLLGLPPQIQNRLFELYVSIFDLLIQNARVEGNLDTGIVDLKASLIELQGTPKTVHVDQISGASTFLFTFILDRGISWELANTMLNEKQKDGLGSPNDGFYVSEREWLGRCHFILAFESSASAMYKIVRPHVGESTREMHLEELKRKYRKISSSEEAQTGWEDEYEASSKQCMHGPKCKFRNYCTVGSRLQEVNVLGGLIFPVWKTIEMTLSKQTRRSHKKLHVVRIETNSDNQCVVGLRVPNAAVKTVLEGLAWVQDVN